ncbi:hypothetical protein N7447_003591 [Penicillium robsamsonii]|uniref:uncharacterized protein n=1 Tax=Penicillium robsamsonii TaxID=1792511 RepID=UPI00254969C9|nr:uncharacterized protein N7447_003591 [Penicillium robsamsonii]KAJ5826828.1 hypothetical protein N7447_003591 [Penicillium robsamsonii]
MTAGQTAGEPEAAETPPAPSSLPHRQSCDRCHKQKLRCIREPNTGVCDRCLRKRAQCVYSFSLPKGRPTMYRSGGAGGTVRPGTASAPLNSRATSPPVEPVKPVCKYLAWYLNSDRQLTLEIEASGTTNIDIDENNATKDTTQVANPTTNDNPVLTTVMDSGPRLEQLSWDDMQLDGEWNSQDPTQVDKLLTSLGAFCNEGSAPDAHTKSSPDQLHFHLNTSNLHAYDHGLPTGGFFQSHEIGRAEIDRGMGDVTMNTGLEKPIHIPSIAVTQLSQLSMDLALLRYTSYSMAKAAESPSCHMPNDRRIPLIDGSAFEFVSTWLAHGQGFAGMNPLAPGSCENQVPYPTPISETGTCAGRTLREVFCSSQRLLEILGQLQFSLMVELNPYPSPIITPPERPSTAVSGGDSGSIGLPNGSGIAGRSVPCPNPANGTVQVIHYLVMACEALLLEIYVAVLVALQHEAYSSTNGTVLGDVRLVLVVELCSYLIERQLQAVDSYLASQSRLNPHNVSGSVPGKFDIPGGPDNLDKDRDMLNDLRNQVQERLRNLRQTLRCR